MLQITRSQQHERKAAATADRPSAASYNASAASPHQPTPLEHASIGLHQRDRPHRRIGVHNPTGLRPQPTQQTVLPKRQEAPPTKHPHPTKHQTPNRGNPQPRTRGIPHPAPYHSGYAMDHLRPTPTTPQTLEQTTQTNPRKSQLPMRRLHPTATLAHPRRGRGMGHRPLRTPPLPTLHRPSHRRGPHHPHRRGRDRRPNQPPPPIPPLPYHHHLCP